MPDDTMAPSIKEASMPEVQLNVCAMQAPEPMERVLAALCKLDRANRLAVLIEGEPHPLYRILDRYGYRHCIARLPDQRYELLIWHAI